MKQSIGGQQLQYLLRKPLPRANSSKAPLLLFLHGAGERGTDLRTTELHGPSNAYGEAAELAPTATPPETNDTGIETPDKLDQLDIDETIANAKAKAKFETSTHEANNLQGDGIVAAETELAPPVTADTKAEVAPVGDGTDIADLDLKADAGPRLGFIPSQTTSLPDADSVPEAIETPAKRPASLISKISDLWSSKPCAAEPESRKEPAIGESRPTASILDLSRSNVVTSETTEPTKANLQMSDDELDIPAFLRRQAN